MARRSRGITLVEIIVVIAIMLIMMSILFPAVRKVIEAVHALGPQPRH